MLRRRHDVAVASDDVAVEPFEADRCLGGEDGAPELGFEPRHEVDAAHRRSRLAQRRDHGNELTALPAVDEVELEISVRSGSESEDPCLRSVDAPNRKACDNVACRSPD